MSTALSLRRLRFLFFGFLLQIALQMIIAKPPCSIVKILQFGDCSHRHPVSAVGVADPNNTPVIGNHLFCAIRSISLLSGADRASQREPESGHQQDDVASKASQEPQR